MPAPALRPPGGLRVLLACVALTHPAAGCAVTPVTFGAAASGAGDPVFSLYTAAEFSTGAQPSVGLGVHPVNALAASSVPTTLCLEPGDYVVRIAVALGADPTGDTAKTFGGVTLDGSTYTMKAPGSPVADAQAGTWDAGTLATTWAITYPASCYAQLAVVATVDSYPSEGSWELVNTATSATVHSVGSLAPPSSRSVELCLTQPAVYEIRLHDSYGDGGTTLAISVTPQGAGAAVQYSLSVSASLSTLSLDLSVAGVVVTTTTTTTTTTPEACAGATVSYTVGRARVTAPRR